MLAINLALPSSAKRTIYGLTGYYDGNQENDLMKSDGSSYINIESTESEIFDWAKECKCVRSTAPKNSPCMKPAHSLIKLLTFRSIPLSPVHNSPAVLV